MAKFRRSQQFENHMIDPQGRHLIDHGPYYTYKGKDHLW
jgi:hypothetical protein